MKAVVIEGPGKLAILEKPVSEPGPGEVLIRVKYCGICGSDLHAYKTGFLQPDLTIGHEFSGIIEAVGPDCPMWAPGDRVTGNNIIACGSCLYCSQGRDNICPNMQRLGITGDGAMAEFILFPQTMLYRLVAQTPLEIAALTEPLSVGIHALKKVQPLQVREALIVGAGSIGLMLLVLLKQCGLDKIIVAEPNLFRGRLAQELGASDLINPDQQSLEREIDHITNSCGINLVFECAGNAKSIETAVDLGASGSQIVVMSICHEPVELGFLSLVTREKTIITAFGKTQSDFKEAVEMINSGYLSLSPLITGTVPLESAEEGFSHSAANTLKTLVKFA